MQPMNMGGFPGAPQMGQGFAIPSQVFAQPMVADLAMQYGASMVGAGRQIVDRELEKYVPVSRLKYYFAVDSKYVTNKLRLLFFPFTHSVSSFAIYGSVGMLCSPLICFHDLVP